MRGFGITVLFIVIAIGLAQCDPMWKVFCTTDPLYRGRADPIIAPGAISGHSHKVWGASNFGIFDASTSYVDVFNTLRKSSCNTCSITKDMSNYWTPDLYYTWPNGTLSLVPTGGLTVYYESRRGPSDKTKPAFVAFPPGLRMIAGNPFRRSMTNTSDYSQLAITFACLGGNVPEQTGFPTAHAVCSSGLRAQIFFPMCWDGVNLDSPDHASHMSYPINGGYNGGDCPSSHPKKIPGIFFEILYDVGLFTHGTGTNPFVLACGDPTGFGLHGDFLNGWDQAVVAQALVDPSCDLDTSPNLASSLGNNVSACNTLAPYLVSATYCPLNKPIPNYEDIGINHPISQLAGCNPITFGPAAATPCSVSPKNVTIPSYVTRVLIQSVATGLYVFCASSNTPLIANTTLAQASRLNVFEFFAIPGGYSILPEGTKALYVTSDNYNSNFLSSNRGSPSGWETFTITFVTKTQITILAQSNSKYVSVQTSGYLQSTATTVTSKETFNVVILN